MGWFSDGSSSGGASLAEAYLTMKSTLKTWKEELEHAPKDDDGRTAKRIAHEIGKYLESDLGAKRFVKLVEIFRVYAGKWQ